MTCDGSCPQGAPCWCALACDENCSHLTDDTVPIRLVVCEHTDSPWCPRCAGGLQ